MTLARTVPPKLDKPFIVLNNVAKANYEWYDSKTSKNEIDCMWNFEHCISMHNALYWKKGIVKLSLLNQV